MQLAGVALGVPVDAGRPAEATLPQPCSGGDELAPRDDGGRHDIGKPVRPGADRLVHEGDHDRNVTRSGRWGAGLRQLYYLRRRDHVRQGTGEDLVPVLGGVLVAEGYGR